MNIVFAGTPEFAVPGLKSLIEKGYPICAVYTKPDRPAGRGRKMTQSPVKAFALTHQIPIYQPETLRDPNEQLRLAELKPDLIVVAAYGLILPESVLKIPKWGCINIHASLLPRWRGASPIQHAILSGDEQTGITIMQMDVGLDTGDILYQMACPIEKEDTSQTLHDRLAMLGSIALIEALEQLFAGHLKAVRQEEDAVTYAHKISKEDGSIDWTESADILERKVRAFNPWPAAYTHLKEMVIRVWQAEVLDLPFEPSIIPGTVVQSSKLGIDVATGNRILRLTQLQLPGGKTLFVKDILNAHQDLFKPGTVFTTVL